jgi:hypothetical protein
MNKPQSLAKKFWSKVEMIPFHSCWEWTGCTTNKTNRRYGRITHKGKLLIATRVSYELHKGKIEKGFLVLHSCDNPLCVNPNHLSLGTPKQNSLEMSARNRNLKGHKHHNAKLTEKIVLEIRALKISQGAIARLYGITQTNVSVILRRKGWKHI